MNTLAPAPTVAVQAPPSYLLHLADNALVLAQRNAEWCGHGPILEEDLALANMSLDLIGQARLLYTLLTERIQPADPAQPPDACRWRATARAWADRNAGVWSEDTLAYFRSEPEFRNHTLLELPHHSPLVGYAKAEPDYAYTITRNLLHSAYMVPLWQQLSACGDPELAAIAAKSLKEARYHLRHARDWFIKLGDGTDESHTRMQQALDDFWPYTQEWWTTTALEKEATETGLRLDGAQLADEFDALVDEALAQATLRRPAPAPSHVTQGKEGLHSEHLGYLLAEMQSLARAHPGASW